MCHLVAHRGQQETFPENTLESIVEAIRCGARAVEFDIQMSADQIPVVCHDVNLLRTSGVDIDITKHKYDEIKNISVGEPLRFENQYSSIMLPTLSAMVKCLKDTPDVLAFVEIKDESISEFGVEIFTAVVVTELQPINNSCVILANNLDVLLFLKAKQSIPVGWIIHGWNEDLFAKAAEYGVEYLVIHQQHLPTYNYDYKSDPWKWFVYEIDNPEIASRLFEQGVAFVETNNICKLIKEVDSYQ